MKITFPHLGNAFIAGKGLLQDLGLQVVVPPKSSRRTLELGTKYSPETICLPLKIMIGNYIESIELGADTVFLVGSSGPCRFGHYGSMQRDILIGLGYDIDFIIVEPVGEGLNNLLASLSKLSKNSSKIKSLRALRLGFQLIEEADNLTILANNKRAWAHNYKEVNKIMDNFYKRFNNTDGGKEILNLLKETRGKLEDIKLDESKSPLKIGIIGEIYTIIEPFVNFEIEKRLGEMGVMVESSLTPTIWVQHHIKGFPFGSKSENNKYKLAQPYLSTMVGGHGRETIGSAIDFHNRGFDGLIQILPLNCMPEIVAKPILTSVSRDLNIPILSLVIDEMTGDAGVMTRIEAFIDLLNRKKEEKVIG